MYKLWAKWTNLINFIEHKTWNKHISLFGVQSSTKFLKSHIRLQQPYIRKYISLNIHVPCVYKNAYIHATIFQLVKHCQIENKVQKPRKEKNQAVTFTYSIPWTFLLYRYLQRYCLRSSGLREAYVHLPRCISSTLRHGQAGVLLLVLLNVWKACSWHSTATSTTIGLRYHRSPCQDIKRNEPTQRIELACLGSR